MNYLIADRQVVIGGTLRGVIAVELTARRVVRGDVTVDGDRIDDAT